ncbi:MAG: DMT family transporter [Bacteroidales bacterium]|nr:DMT family transporter [Bacteroidales bacterium]
MKQQTKAYLFASFAVLCWSTVGSAFKLALREVDFVNLLFWSVLVSLLVFIVFIMVQKKWGLLWEQKLKDVLMSALLGFLNPFFYYFILFQAYDVLLAQEALTLNYLWPVVLVLLSIPILKQKIGILSFVAILISFTGSFVIATGGDIFGFQFTNPYGVALAVGSTVIWALFWLLNVKDKRTETVKLLMNFFFGFLYILIYGLFTDSIIIPEFYGIIGVSYVGVFEMGITFFLWMKALSLSKTTAKISNLIYFAPFLSLIIVSITIGEQIKTATVVGLVLIIGGILLQGLGGFHEIRIFLKRIMQRFTFH